MGVRMMGPNVKRLIIAKMSRDAVPDGGGLADAIGFLTSKDALLRGAREATKFVEAAIAAVKAAPDNKWGDDEAIAGEILKQIELRNGGAK